ASVHHKSASVHHKSASVHHKSASVHHKSASIHHKSSSIHHKSASVHHKSASIHHKSASIHHISASVHHKSASVHHKSASIHHKSALLPGPSFCLHNHPGWSPLGLPVPVSCLRSSTSQPGPIGLLLQLDGILYFLCPPPGSGIAASIGTGDLTAATLSSRFDNVGGEHGPLGLNIYSLPRDLVEAPPEVGVEDLCQTFPADPYSTLGSAESV
ncbi:melatonin-related receptor, partial [Pimephales promelas]